MSTVQQLCGKLHIIIIIIIIINNNNTCCLLTPIPAIVPNFLLDFEKKPTENRNNFQHREHILRAEIVRKLIRCGPKWYLHHLAQKCVNITALRHSTPASFRLFKMAKRVGVVNVEEIRRQRREHSAFFSVNAHCQIVLYSH